MLLLQSYTIGGRLLFQSMFLYGWFAFGGFSLQFGLPLLIFSKLCTKPFKAAYDIDKAKGMMTGLYPTVFHVQSKL